VGQYEVAARGQPVLLDAWSLRRIGPPQRGRPLATGRFHRGDGARRTDAQRSLAAPRLGKHWSGAAFGDSGAGGSAPIRYGLDAARLPIWFSTACTDDARRLAARWWVNVLATDNRAADLALSTAGAHLNEQTNPLPLLAGAAAANAAGDTAATRALHRRAVAQSHQTPTYYGDAWLALAGALLDRTLDPCREAADA